MAQLLQESQHEVKVQRNKVLSKSKRVNDTLPSLGKIATADSGRFFPSWNSVKPQIKGTSQQKVRNSGRKSLYFIGSWSSSLTLKYLETAHGQKTSRYRYRYETWSLLSFIGLFVFVHTKKKSVLLLTWQFPEWKGAWQRKSWSTAREGNLKGPYKC